MIAAAFPAELVDLETGFVVEPRADIAAVAEIGIARPLPAEQRCRPAERQILYPANDFVGIEPGELVEVTSAIFVRSRSARAIFDRLTLIFITAVILVVITVMIQQV